jgi:hypothetical protein
MKHSIKSLFLYFNWNACEKNFFTCIPIKVKEQRFNAVFHYTVKEGSLIMKITLILCTKRSLDCCWVFRLIVSYVSYKLWFGIEPRNTTEHALFCIALTSNFAGVGVRVWNMCKNSFTKYVWCFIFIRHCVSIILILFYSLHFYLS